MELLLVRHGVTAENLKHVMIGRTDPPLHEYGERQAQAIGEHLRDVQIAAIYTSPLQRAKQTADAIAAFHPSVPVKVHSGLRELDLGIVDGMSVFDAYDRERDLMTLALDPETPDFAFPGGELRSQALTRFTNALAECTAYESDDRIVIVTHGGVIGLWLAARHGRPLGTFRSSQSIHGAISRITYDGREYRLTSYNQTDHLPSSLLEAIEVAKNMRR